jgi:hypothetical protein
MAEDLDDYYMQGSEVKINDQESDYGAKETRRKLKEIIEIQRRREKEVESIDEDYDVKASSIVIERLNIMPQINISRPENGHNFNGEEGKYK